MSKLDYIPEGQMSLFDFVEEVKPIRNPGVGTLFRLLRYGPHTMVPEVVKDCRRYIESVGGVDNVPTFHPYDFSKAWDGLPCLNCEYLVDGLCRYGAHTVHYEYDKFLVCDAFKGTIDAKPKCQHSNHVCNKQNLWEVADTLDDIECPRVCCRQCEVPLCGARCNGSEEPQKHEDPQTSTEVVKKSCSNCLRHNKDIEQPPAGWGSLGWCAEHNHKTQDISYCDSWEPKPVEVMSCSTKDYAKAIVKHLIEHCRKWGSLDDISKLRESRTPATFHKLFCTVTRTYYFHMGEPYFSANFTKENTVEIKRCGRDYRDRPLDATIQLQDVLDELGE